MFEAVGSRIVSCFDAVASFDIVGAIVLGDDLGFKTQTLLSPASYREYLFPWHKKIVDAVHRHGKLAILHACGNVTEIMDDIIACGWDARHSFEDVIEPVWEAKERYGDRISVLGGFDMDKLCTMSEDEVRAHTRFLIDCCAPGGGWALGTGNSVANYIPLENYLAMLDEGLRYGVY
jgi:uroporphyrinogen decarboxylase